MHREGLKVKLVGVRRTSVLWSERRWMLVEEFPPGDAKQDVTDSNGCAEW